MRLVDGIGWLCAVLVVLVYLVGTPRQFDVANVVFCVPVAMPALVRRAYPSAALSLAFGVFGALHLMGVSL